MSGYGKRAVPVGGAKGLSSEALARWRSRARSLLDQAPAADAPGEAPVAAPESVADPSQRRKNARQKTLIGAKVVFNDMMSVYDCTIRDLSARGARVKLNAPVQVPQAFMLRFSDGRIRQCKVRRRSALELGIEFLD